MLHPSFFSSSSIHAIRSLSFTLNLDAFIKCDVPSVTLAKANNIGPRSGQSDKSTSVACNIEGRNVVLSFSSVIFAPYFLKISIIA